jgi:hypothetical protein
VSTLLAVYAAGIAAGLIIMRDPWPSRIATAMAWPLGILSFVVVLAIMSAAAIYLWPVPILTTLALVSLGWLAIR